MAKLVFCQGSALDPRLHVERLVGSSIMVFPKKQRSKSIVVYIKWVCHPYVGSATALPDTQNIALLQYVFTHEEHDVKVAPHGNSLKKQGYARTMPSN